jgi:hypothetical protein
MKLAIGYRVQTLQVGLDFTRSDSALFYDEFDVCPIGVDCYSLWDSFTGSIYTHDDGTKYVVDRCRSKNSLFGWERYLKLEAPPPNTVKFRDVGGVIGTNPESEFFNDSVLEISRNEQTGIRMQTRASPAAPDIVFVESLSDSEWKFEGFIGNEMTSQFVIDLSGFGNDLVLPLTHRVASFCDLLVDRSNDCLGLETGQWMELHTDIKIVSPWGEFALKPSRFRFSQLIDSVRLGIAFLSSIDRLYLDFADQSIGMILGPWKDLSLLVKHLVPIRAWPRTEWIIKNLELRIDMRETDLLTDGFLQINQEPILSVTPEGESLECIQFRRVSDSVPFPVKPVVIEGPFRDMSFNSAHGLAVLSWRLRKCRSGRIEKIVIRQTDQLLEVCGAVALSLDKFDLPKPEMLAQNQECPICLSAIGQGESAQRLRECRHVFHEDCVKHWLHRAASCPCCRAEVKERRSREFFRMPSLEDAHKFTGCAIT